MSQATSLNHWLSTIAASALEGNARKSEILIAQAIRALKKTDPVACVALGDVLAKHAAGSLRSAAVPPPPADADEGMALVRVETPTSAPSPVFSADVAVPVDQMLAERRNPAPLAKEGLAPTSSLLLTGKPGTGKTMLARWLASELQVPLVTLDLATAISSYLGKTGFNLRRSLDYARSSACVLLLDEFDAVAKRRDDDTEVGELKRIVNVLLKELETWPSQSLLVAATNHPELLDRAIARRFELVVEVPMPAAPQRVAIMNDALGRFVDEIACELVESLALNLDEVSGSDLHRATTLAIRKHLTTGIPIETSLVSEALAIRATTSSKKVFGDLVRGVREHSRRNFSERELAAMFGCSPGNIHYHLAKATADG